MITIRAFQTEIPKNGYSAVKAQPENIDFFSPSALTLCCFKVPDNLESSNSTVRVATHYNIRIGSVT